MAPPDGLPVPVRMVFDQSVRGLAEGAPIDFLGIEIGKVTSIALQYDAASEALPDRGLRRHLSRCAWARCRNALLQASPTPAAGDVAVLQQLVANGLRAQLRTGNLLTGQLYVALDFLGKEPGRSAVLSDGVLDGADRAAARSARSSRRSPRSSRR